MVDLTCSTCEGKFCANHGLQHLGQTCLQFQNSPQGKALAETERALEKFTKECKRCGCRVQKSFGCDHVVCGACHGEMCWRCGTHEHLEQQRPGVQFCKNCRQRLVGHNRPVDPNESSEQRRLRRFMNFLSFAFQLFCYLVLTIVWVLLAAIFAAVTCCFGCFFGGGALALKEGEGEWRHGIVLTLVAIFLPIVAVLEQSGYLENFHVLHEIFEEHGEIPFMDVEAPQSTGNDDLRKNDNQDETTRTDNTDGRPASDM